MKSDKPIKPLRAQQKRIARRGLLGSSKAAVLKRLTRARMKAMTAAERIAATERGMRQFGPNAKPHHIEQKELHLAYAHTPDYMGTLTAEQYVDFMALRNALSAVRKKQDISTSGRRSLDRKRKSS